MYINGTWANTIGLIPSALQKISAIYFYGPGYVSQETLSEGIERYVEMLDNVDFMVINAQCLVNKDIASFSRFLKRYTAVFNSGTLTPNFIDDVGKFCKNNKKRVIATVLDLDPHVTPQYMIDSLLEGAQYFMGWGNGFLNSRGYLTSNTEEKYIQKK